MFEQVAAAYGIQLQFEDGYQGPVSAFTLRMNDLSMPEAFHALETITNSFLVPVNPKLAMVYQDTTQRRNDSAPLVTAEIPIPERISVQEAQEMVSAVQQVMQVRRIAVDPGRRMVFLRDQPGTDPGRPADPDESIAQPGAGEYRNRAPVRLEEFEP